jgi:hypothetical protein
LGASKSLVFDPPFKPEREIEYPLWFQCGRGFVEGQV